MYRLKSQPTPQNYGSRLADAKLDWLIDRLTFEQRDSTGAKLCWLIDVLKIQRISASSPKIGALGGQLKLSHPLQPGQSARAEN